MPALVAQAATLGGMGRRRACKRAATNFKPSRLGGAGAIFSAGPISIEVPAADRIAAPAAI